MENTNPTDSKKEKKVILPIKGKRNVLITSALPYVNNVPHLGNIIGCVLSADVYARYCRLRGYNTLYVCGTDEYGTATETKALKEGCTPLEICNKYHKIHKEIYEWFGISFDHFGRTTTEQQTQIAQQIFNKINENKFLVEQTVEQLYCTTCTRYVADRFVEGICPLCSYPDARGDQCDGCGKLLNATELISPKCAVCKEKAKHAAANNLPPPPVVDLEKRSEDHLFLDLPTLTEKLEDWIKTSSSSGWSANSIQTTNGWLKSGLKPRCITRDLKWGTPVPVEKYKDKVFYVWFDAPIGYISITANYTDQWEQWWRNPEDVQLCQFMGKDNIPFHTVIFPASLLATGETWTLLNTISTTEYLNYENQQFSKSRGVGVFGDGAKDTGVPQHVWRYYLLSNRPETSDSEFTWSDFVTRNNSELLATLGNFCHRCLTFCESKFEGKIPKFFHENNLEAPEKELKDSVDAQVALYIEAMEQQKLRDGLAIAMAIARLGNAYLQSSKPWELSKAGNNEKCGEVIHVACNLVLLLARLLSPFMPTLSEELIRQLGAGHLEENIQGKWVWELKGGEIIQKPSPVIAAIPKEKVDEWISLFGPHDTEKKPELTTNKKDLAQAKKAQQKGKNQNANPQKSQKSQNPNPKKSQEVGLKFTAEQKKELAQEIVVEVNNLIKSNHLENDQNKIVIIYKLNDDLGDLKSEKNSLILNKKFLPQGAIILFTGQVIKDNKTVELLFVKESWVLDPISVRKNKKWNSEKVLNVQQLLHSRSFDAVSGNISFVLDKEEIVLVVGTDVYPSVADWLKAEKEKKAK